MSELDKFSQGSWWYTETQTGIGVVFLVTGIRTKKSTIQPRGRKLVSHNRVQVYTSSADWKDEFVHTAFNPSYDQQYQRLPNRQAAMDLLQLLWRNYEHSK